MILVVEEEAGTAESEQRPDGGDAAPRDDSSPADENATAKDGIESSRGKQDSPVSLTSDNDVIFL